MSGGYVISYSFGGRTFHAQVLPDRDVSAEEPGQTIVFYSLDDGKTRFFDLLQMVEFYQLNRGSLNSRLTHYIVRVPIKDLQQQQEQQQQQQDDQQQKSESASEMATDDKMQAAAATTATTETETAAESRQRAESPKSRY